MKVRLFSLVVVLALVSTFVLTAFSPVEAKRGGSYPVPITGTTDSGGTFSGIYEITRFAVQNGELVAIGNLTGTLSEVVDPVSQALTLPVANLIGDCEILHLELGPLELNLLGLNVNLNQVVLDITATPGGGLLGSLLCAVANLLNGNAALNAIAALLNQILGALG